jgi:hypothetical protein
MKRTLDLLERTTGLAAQLAFLPTNLASLWADLRRAKACKVENASSPQSGTTSRISAVPPESMRWLMLFSGLQSPTSADSLPPHRNAAPAEGIRDAFQQRIRPDRADLKRRL